LAVSARAQSRAGTRLTWWAEGFDMFEGRFGRVSAFRGRHPAAVVVGMVLALALVGPAAAAPGTAPGAALPASAPVHVDIVTMVASDVGGGEVHFGTVRLNTYWNAAKTQWTKQTLRFSMYNLNASGVHYARIFQGTCDDESPHYVIRIKVRANSAGRLTSTTTLTTAQRAIMSSLAQQYPAVSMVVEPEEPWTGVGYPCGRIWDEG
jgi:hypothetical protein